MILSVGRSLLSLALLSCFSRLRALLFSLSLSFVVAFAAARALPVAIVTRLAAEIFSRFATRRGSVSLAARAAASPQRTEMTRRASESLREPERAHAGAMRSGVGGGAAPTVTAAVAGAPAEDGVGSTEGEAVGSAEARRRGVGHLAGGLIDRAEARRGPVRREPGA